MNRMYQEMIDLTPDQSILQESTRELIWKKAYAAAKKTYEAQKWVR